MNKHRWFQKGLTVSSIFDNKLNDFFKEFGVGKAMVLSSSQNDKVTSRMMSIVQDNGLFYFQTDKTFKKYGQLMDNPNVALCISNIQIEGVCEEIGHPMKDANFCNLYQEYFSSSFKKYSALENERLFVIRPTYIKRWIYIDGVPNIETWDIEKEDYKLVEYVGQ